MSGKVVSLVKLPLELENKAPYYHKIFWTLVHNGHPPMYALKSVKQLIDLDNEMPPIEISKSMESLWGEQEIQEPMTVEDLVDVLDSTLP